MPFLETFDWEIFLSYGWAENPEEDMGTRLWAKNLRDHLMDQLGANLISPRIFFDAEDLRPGNIDEELRKAVEGSALMVFVVSPGSYREGSFCHKEAAYFWDRARALASTPEVLAPENRIFKVIQTRVTRESGSEPSPLKDTRTFNTYDRASGLSQDIAYLKQSTDLELKRLVEQLVQGLKQVKKLEGRRHSGKRVFLGPAFSPFNRNLFLTLRRELLLDGHEVLSSTPLSSDCEEEYDFRGRIQRAHEGTTLAVHLVPQWLDSPKDWKRNHAANAISYSLQKSMFQESFSVYLWKDPDQDQFDPQCLRLVEKFPAVAGNQNTNGLYDGLREYVKTKLQQKHMNGDPTEPLIDVVIEHWDSDSSHAARIRDLLKQRGFITQFAIPTEKSTNRLRVQKKNQERFYQKAKRFVVLYGRANDEWTNDICYGMQPYIREDGTALVLLVPPDKPPIGKQFYVNPFDVQFQTRSCFDENYAGVLDAWLGQGPNRP